MSYIWRATAAAILLAACSGEKDALEPDADADGTTSGSGGSGSDTTESLPLMDDGAARDPDSSGGSEPDSSAAPGVFTLFMDPSSGFTTDAVHDADREIVRFDPSLGAMIWAASGDAVSGWTTQGADLSWSRSGVAFMVRFGTEQGERRAYFTETGSGTICNLNITEPERLSISPTNEPPPQ